MNLRQHSTSILDIVARGSSTDIVHDPTSLTEWFKGPSQITIGGNARVHLGDQHNNGTDSTSNRRQSTIKRDYKNLDAIGTAFQVIDFCASILSMEDHDGYTAYESTHVRLACVTLQSFQHKLLVFITRLDCSLGLGSNILTEVLNGCSNIAEGLAASLNGMFNATIGSLYSSLRQIIASACSEEHMAEMLVFLQNLREKALLALLVILR